MRRWLLVFTILTAGCGMPQYKEVWESYRAPEYPLSAADAICTEYGVQVQQQQLNERRQSNQSQDINVNVDLGNNPFSNSNYEPDFSGAFAGLPNAAAYNACMAKIGYQQVRRCVKNCK